MRQEKGACSDLLRMLRQISNSALGVQKRYPKKNLHNFFAVRENIPEQLLEKVQPPKA